MNYATISKQTHWSAFFTDKSNFLNVYFVKWGWIWYDITYLVNIKLPIKFRTIAPIAIIILTTRLLSAKKLLLVTAYWFIWTQWFFGHSLFDRLFHHYPWAYCVNQDHSSYFECKKSGHRWLSFDASGHCFLMIHSSLYLWEELRSLNKRRRLLKALIPRIAMFLAYGVLIIWLAMLISTSMFYHTWYEKLVGSFVGMSFWLIQLRY